MNTDNIHNNNNNSKKVYNKKQQLNNSHNHINTTRDNNNNNNIVNNSNNITNGKKSQFQDAVVAKSDVGEFSGGYFIMPSSEQDNLKMKRPIMNMQKNSSRKKLPPTVGQLEQQYKEQQQLQQQQQQSEPIKQQVHKTPVKQQQQQKQFNNSNNNEQDLLLTPTFLLESPKGKQQNSKVLSPQSLKQQQFNVNTTPLRSNSSSPKKTFQPPTQNLAWAGGAFNNSPSPSSLPMPNFDDEPSISQVDLQTLTIDLRRLLNITPTISVSES